jgi:hypothetical protein
MKPLALKSPNDFSNLTGSQAPGAYWTTSTLKLMTACFLKQAVRSSLSTSENRKQTSRSLIMWCPDRSTRKHNASVFGPSQNCGAREITDARNRLWNNVHFYATAAKQRKDRPLLDSRYSISENTRPLLRNDSVNTFPRKQNTRINGAVWAGRADKL